MERTVVLAISGSLRRESYNTAAIEALSLVAPENAEVQVYKELGDLPPFNPDLDVDAAPSVIRLKRAIREAHGLVIASPEYAHGISGVLKNALDWLVSGEEFVSIPVALINTSPRASHAQAALREVVKTMSGIIIEDACVSIPLLGSGLGRDSIVGDPEMAGQLSRGISEFCVAVRAIRLNKSMHATSA
ncbi:MAG: NADPH-dependent FMN reductase [Aquisalimonadaceae bacterium]